MKKPVGINVAARAIALATGPEIPYNEVDCQALVEKCVNDCGGSMAYAGSNAMARAVVWLGTIANAQAEGMLVPGALLFIHEPDESGLPAKYCGDGLGDFSHVGIYVGENALYDKDKQGKSRLCSVVHSSSSMGRVAGSTLKNGWTHVGWMPEIDYGMEAPSGVKIGAEVSAEDAMPESTGIVYAENGKPVKMRQSPSAACKLYWNLPVGMAVEVLNRGDTWSKIRCMGRVGYMMTKFIS